MLISKWIESFTGQQRMVEDLTRKIAARCEPAVWARIEKTAPQLDPAQARGYIRARAAEIIHREAHLMTQNVVDGGESLADRVIRSTSNVIVRRMMSAIAVQHPTEIRRAA